ncbi:unnamed protein product [Closterium sp. NIES-54]
MLAWGSEGLGFESRFVHFGHPSAGGCRRSTGDPRLILGRGYRRVGLGGYGRTVRLLNKPFYPNGLVVGILTQEAYNYVITFIDAATRYVWHLDLPSRDMAFEAFVAWLSVAERESGAKLKSFQSDGGGEYQSQRFRQYLAERGIKRLISLPYAHQQQGVAERMNRTLQNTMRKLLHGMRLPNHQWLEAMDHAVMLHNLLSLSSLPNNASPCQNPSH